MIVERATWHIAGPTFVAAGVSFAHLWAACIGGAGQQDSYRAAIEAAGLRIERFEENPGYHFISERAQTATAKWGVKSVSILARKS